jgi:murein DD-endopeptidase MepM/ murein hydrolase activator NlpD
MALKPGSTRVVLDHGNGMQTYYANLSSFSVIEGQEIRRGELVGRPGATGKVTAPHLHYEVRIGGTPVNPYKYLADSFDEQPTPARKDFPF